MEKWVLVRKGAPFNEIAEKFHIHPIIARLIRNRNIVGDEAIDKYLNGTISDLYDGMLMKDMHKAVDILIEKIRERKKIRIIGDYDIDGINATYILLEGLKKLGAYVDTDIPDRIKDGYGLNRQLIDKAWTDHVDTIITCDNGIAASEEIMYGNELGMTIIVTDHHEIPYEETVDGRKEIVPPASAVVDPKQSDCAYPFSELCGAAVAYKVIETLFEVLDKDIEEVDYLMENVAIATVGDVMPLVEENRIFVKQGLEMLGRTNNMGLQALMEVNDIPKDKISAYHIGFVLGPCLNAAGRLETAKKALSLLSSETKEEAMVQALELKQTNEQRKEMTLSAVDDAIELIENSSIKSDKVLVVYLPNCHESLAGIVAGRIREKYNKPTFVLTKTQEGVKGSGRSIDSYNMHEALSMCHMLLTKYGGHQLAAGLSLEEKNIEPLRCMLNQKAELTDEDLIPKVAIDMQVPFQMISEELIDQLGKLEPFGRENTKPIFAEKDVEILNGRIFESKQNVLRMQVVDAEGTRMNAVYFGEVQRFLDFLVEKYDEETVDGMLSGRRTGIRASIAYYPAVNEYMDKKYLQITISHFQ